MNKKCLDKFRLVIELVIDALYENFSYWFVYENKQLVAASSILPSQMKFKLMI